jgi:hypothetical protein
VGTRKPDGYGFGQNFKPVMGTGFLTGVNIFHGYGFGIAKPGGFIPVAISIHELLRCFEACDVRHVYREGNKVAHTLCRQAYHCPGVWVGTVPFLVFDKAEEDRHGVLHERAVVR